MKTPNGYLDIRTGRMSLEKWLNVNYPEFYKHLKDCYKNIDIKTSLYMYFNNIHEIPKCTCGNRVKFHGYIYGFSKFCCSKCASNDKTVQDKLNSTLKNKYGDSARKIISDKSRSTKLLKYGDSNFNNSKKTKQTCSEKYGVDNPMKSKEIQNKSKQTCLEKYGAEYFFNSDQYKFNRNEHINKTKQTCLEKYGGVSPMADEVVKNKTKQTCLERYGVEWNCMRPEAKNSRNYNSRPNELFKDILEENHITYEREFKVGDKLYDFKVDNILIEINPSPTHNTNWNPYGGKVMDSMYHFNKTKNAHDNGYFLLNIWDWDDINKILNIIDNKNKKIIGARQCFIKELNNKTCNEFLDKYHLQNSCKSQRVKIGLFYNNELVAVMTFGKPRYNNKFEWELLRLCYHKDYKISGGTKKMFNYFIEKYSPNNIISYCDLSKFKGDVYSNLGFDALKILKPSRHWYNIKTGQHITDNLLRSRGFDQLFNTNFGKGSSNAELMKMHNFIEIYDAGQKTYMWSKNTQNY